MILIYIYIKVNDQAKGLEELLIKEALNIHLVPEKERLNRDIDIHTWWTINSKRWQIEGSIG